jgi:hypothetical protein
VSERRNSLVIATCGLELADTMWQHVCNVLVLGTLQTCPHSFVH